jgi:hypothetical protein
VRGDLGGSAGWRLSHLAGMLVRAVLVVAALGLVGALLQPALLGGAAVAGLVLLRRRLLPWRGW